ncbi:Major Facilitator Superfamily protein [Desulfurobacterium pacificum]|uniref:Major Facilitator Superfamily protein n=1 Tax=Desulfurobacterium pacificum TaxID=240166 RepID=A0ABY1NI62_9BACT|nr:MFS transporter [Desulfurobacterium pacificum]SMP10345.1 Major Facilitator Superfamily protein [Desulfurobacterium pacificum]
MKKNVYLLSVVSLLNDISSEIILSVLPLFITSLGGGGFSIGLIGGFRDFVSNFVKVISGVLSDKFRSKKPFVIAGYGISAFFKFFIGFAKTPFQVLIATVFERIGKGVRTAPRDAIISLSASSQGKGFGLHRAFDTLGALIGTLLALLMVAYWHASYRKVILFAAIISFVSLLPLLFVEEPKVSRVNRKISFSFSFLDGRFKKFLFVAALFAFSSVSYMFFMLRAEEITHSKVVPIVLYAVFNLFYAFLSVPAGVLGDKVGRLTVLSIGYGISALSLLFLAFSNGFMFLVLSFVFYGAAMALIDGTQRAVVGEFSKEEYRASAYGVFHFLTGLFVLLGNVVLGGMWEVGGFFVLLVYSFISFSSAVILKVLL